LGTPALPSLSWVFRKNFDRWWHLAVI
jgi:hypothetical protein